nr:hypothetical protein [Tanacetum cinerariifolium]
MPPKKRTTTTTITTPMTDTQLKALITQGVANALAEIEANKTTKNGDDNHDFGTGSRRTERPARECNYRDFLKCQPINFKCTEGVVGLTQCALTWWNSHVKVVGHNATYGMTWKSLMKMMTDKYCPRDEIKKLEIEIWNLNYVGGLPDMIQGSVMASKPKTMQEAIEIANDLMDQKVRTLAERQAKNKRKAWGKKPYGGSKPLSPKCNDHHDGQCAPKCANCKRTGHLTQDYRSQPAAANNNQRAQRENQRVLTCFECGAQCHFKSNCPKLKNTNQGNQARNGNAVVRAYSVGTAGTNLNSNVVTASVASLAPVEEAPAPVESTDSHSSTTIDQDASSLST